MTEYITNLLQEQLSSGSILIYLMVFIGGVMASVTPCTYPVLPMTVGYIGSASEGKKGHSFLLSLTLVFGMTMVYGVLGVILAAAGAQFGALWANGWAVFAIAWFFILMALFLMDVWVMPVPKFMRDIEAKAGQKRRKGFFGAFLVGAVSGLVVGPCTGPILGVVGAAVVASLGSSEGLSYAAELVKGGVLLFLFGFGQGALILLCGTFAGLLKRLPKAGAWMVTIKKGFALIILIGASFLLAHAGQQRNFPRLADILASLEAEPEIENSNSSDSQNIQEVKTDDAYDSGSQRENQGSKYGSDELFD